MVQVFNTDFPVEKPDVYFSKYNLYTLITENKNINVFNSLEGELRASFMIQDEKVKAVLIMEEEETLFIVTDVDGNSCRIIRYDISEEKIVQNPHEKYSFSYFYFLPSLLDQPHGLILRRHVEPRLADNRIFFDSPDIA